METPTGRLNIWKKIWAKPPTPPGAILYGIRNQEYPIAKNTDPPMIPDNWVIFLFNFIVTSTGGRNLATPC